MCCPSSGWLAGIVTQLRLGHAYEIAIVNILAFNRTIMHCMLLAPPSLICNHNYEHA